MAARVLKTYTEAFTVFGHTHYPEGLNDTLLFQAYVPETAGSMGRVGSRKNKEPPAASTSSRVLSMTSSNTLRQDHDCILLFVPSEDKLLLILLLYKYEKAAFARCITTRLPGMC